MSVAVTDAFMQAVDTDGTVDLWHGAEPHDREHAVQRNDGTWVYRTARARDLFDQIMNSTYNHAEPGVVFVDRINQDNNLAYCETITATNPCGEQPLPPYGCCCLGSINLTRFVRDPFTAEAAFDFSAFADVVRVAIRALDNVLEATLWPLPEQRAEAANKRRVGLGFTGLGNALTMLNLRYDTERRAHDGRLHFQPHARYSYQASVDLAREKGPFPLLDAEQFLAAPHFASRLPEEIQKQIRIHGIRNAPAVHRPHRHDLPGLRRQRLGRHRTHLLVDLYAQEAHARRLAQEYQVEDHTYRLYKLMGGNGEALPESFVCALDMEALDHMRMIAAVQPFVDAAVSKTVNVPEDYPFEEFRKIYLEAWKSGLKGITTYRPNHVIGEVLSVTPKATLPQTVVDPTGESEGDDANRRVRLDFTPQPALGQPEVAQPAGSVRRQPGLRPARGGVSSRSESFVFPSGRPAVRRLPSRSGSMVPSSRAAWVRSPSRYRWTCAPRTAPGSA